MSSSNEKHTIGAYSAGEIFLRMNGENVTGPMPDGGGEVNCQFEAGPWEHFTFDRQEDGSYAIQSAQFPGVFLRMDGRGLSESNPTGGVVNCQFGIGPWEKFKLKTHQYGYSIESVEFPGVFLSMNGDNHEKPLPSGFGSTACQFGFTFEAPVNDVFIISPPVAPS